MHICGIFQYEALGFIKFRPLSNTYKKIYYLGLGFHKRTPSLYNNRVRSTKVYKIKMVKTEMSF